MATLLTVTPHDTTELSTPCIGLYVGGIGDVTVITVDNETVTFVQVLRSVFFRRPITHVKSTGTDATSIVGIV